MPVRWEPVLGIVSGLERTAAARFLESDFDSTGPSCNAPPKLRAIPLPMRSPFHRARWNAIVRSWPRLTLMRPALPCENALTQNRFNAEAFAFRLRDCSTSFRRPAAPDYKIPSWRTQLPPGIRLVVPGRTLLSRRIRSPQPVSSPPTHPVATQEQRMSSRTNLPVAGIPITLSGWSYTLTDLVPWSHRQLLLISALMAVFDASLAGDPLS